MSKAADLAKVSAKGSFNYLWGLVVSQVISAVGTIFIATLITDADYGLYGIALVAPTLIQLFRDWGINQAMIRYTAQEKAEANLLKIKNIFISGIFFEIALGLILTIISIAFSDVIATIAFNRPAVAPLIQIASFTILAGGLTNAATAAFTGYEEMQLNSIMLICQSIIKTLLMIGLVAFGFGVFGAVTGLTAATLITGLISMLLVWTIYKKLPKSQRKLELKSYIKMMLKYGVPLSLGTILAGFQTAFFNFLLPTQVSDAVYGNYTLAMNFVVLIGFFATPITTMLFPAFSKLDPQKDKNILKGVFQSSIKYAALLVVPVAALVMSLSEPAVSTLFSTKFPTTPLFLALLSISYMYSAFGSLSAGNFIMSQGYTRYILKLNILTALIGFPLGYFLIMQFGVVGLIATTLTCGWPSLLLMLRWIKRHYDITVDWNSSARILFSSILTAGITYLVVSQLTFASWIRLVIGVIVFAFIIVASLLLSRAVIPSDINNLRSMSGEIGVIGKIIHKVLNLIEKIMKKLRL